MGGGGGNGTYRHQLDSEAGSWAETVATQYTPGTPLLDGPHTLYVQERDAVGNWSASGSFAITVDNTAPGVTLEQAAGQADPTNHLPITFDVLFSEPVAGFEAPDVVIGGTAPGVLLEVTGSGAAYSVRVTALGGDGSIVLTVRAGAAQDGAGNPSTASTSVDNVVTYTTQSTILYVDASYSGPEDGSSEHPFNTLGEAVAATLEGRRDVVVVRPGVYTEAVVLKAGTSLWGEQGAYHTWLGWSKAAGDTLTLAPDVWVRGLTIGGASGHAAVAVPTGATANITNCVLCESGSGLAVEPGATLARCVNNTVYGNTVYGVRVESGARIIRVKNNIFSKNGTGLSVAASEITDASYNDYCENVVDREGVLPSTTDLAVDPQFVNAETSNFHLTQTSVCRDAGDPIQQYADVDGSRNDLGADGGPMGVRDVLAPTALIRTTPEPPEGEAPLAVEFDGSGSWDEWGIAQYVWDFDAYNGLQVDGVGPLVTHDYESEGRYTATLTVTDNTGFSSSSEVDVKVAGAPTVIGTVVPLAGPLPLPVEFTAEGQAWDGGPVTFEWDFEGDGTVDGEGSITSHTYEAGTSLGCRRARVSAVDDEGRRAQAFVDLTVTEFPVAAAGLVVPETGGTVCVAEAGSLVQGVCVSVPEGGSSQNIVVTIGAVPDEGKVVPLPRVLLAVEFGPVGVSLAQPATLTLPVAGVASADAVSVLYFDSTTQTWEDGHTSNLTYADELLTCEVAHLGIYAVRQERPCDVNADGRVDALDVQLVINGALGLPTGYLCDVNGDGEVNALDVQLTINAALGL